MGQNYQLIQILIVIVFLALSGIGWLAKQIREQRERRRRQIEQQRRIEEMLRTGRDPVAEQAAALQRAAAADRARLEEIARRRQSQMEQLRREQLQRRQDAERTARESTEIPPIIIMGPTGPIAIPRGPTPGSRGGVPTRPAPIPFPPQGRPAPARPQQRGPRPEKQRPKRDRQGRGEAAPQRPQPARPLVTPEAEAPSIAPPAPPVRGRRSPRAAVALPQIGPGGTGREHYRRLIATLEVLRPPLALRPPEAGEMERAGGASPLMM